MAEFEDRLCPEGADTEPPRELLRRFTSVLRGVRDTISLPKFHHLPYQEARDVHTSSECHCQYLRLPARSSGSLMGFLIGCWAL